ncbi:hypothetical protein VCHC50A2_1456A, partial [Vibrio cholerae HC-50A2]|jgi:large subunit ribosomal protein LP0
MLINS